MRTQRKNQFFPLKILLDLSATIRQNALIDSGAECNVMPYTVWTSLGSPKLTPTSISFVGFIGIKTPSVGKLSINAKIGDAAIPIEFFVAPQDQSDVELLLGRQWISRQNLQLDWHARTFSLKVPIQLYLAKRQNAQCRSS